MRKANVEITLGDYVKDVVTGFVGTAISEHYYLYGCRRITVQPRVDKEGKVPECATFDELSLELVPDEKSLSQARDNSAGGPDKFMDEGR